MRSIRSIAIALVTAIVLSLGGTLNLSAMGQTDAFEQVWQTVNENFYDPNFNGADWQALYEEYRLRTDQARSQPELAQIINQMLSELNASHTHFYTSKDLAYYQLLGVFLPVYPDLKTSLGSTLQGGNPQYSGIGIFTETQAENTFISGVLEGSPAAESGLLVGDQILSANNSVFDPFRSFAGRVGQPVDMVIQRTPEVAQTITVVPVLLDGTTMFLDAMKASVEVVEQADKTIGYVHIWSYAGEQVQQQLQAELAYGRLKTVDSFVLDLRDGWGGANASYLNLYNDQVIQTTGVARGYPPATASSAWNKPVVMLVNGGSRSGKEILAYGFRKYGIGPVVGSTTAGAVLQGNLYPIGSESVLYLAIADILIDGQRLEGKGVDPDVAVPFDLPYARGADPQKDRAVAIAAAAVEQ